MMQFIHLLLLVVGLMCAAITSRAQSYSGVFLTGNGEGAIAGNINLTLNGGQVFFQSTLFQNWTVGTSLEPVWQLQGLQVAFDLGSGTPGSWQLGEFLGPIPGMTPIPPVEESIDPGFNVPVYSDGVRFSGSFFAPDGLENALLTSGGSRAIADLRHSGRRRLANSRPAFRGGIAACARTFNVDVVQLWIGCAVQAIQNFADQRSFSCLILPRGPRTLPA